MASVSTNKAGHRCIQFSAFDGKRRTIRLGKTPQKQAEAIRVKVEHLLTASLSRSPLDSETARWLAGISDRLADRLARCGLIPARRRSTLGAFTRDYINGRTDIKPRTRINLEQARTRLVDYFGEGKPLDQITRGEASQWLLSMKERYAAATASRAARRAQQFLRAAMDHELVSANPFAGLKPGPQQNKARQFFVTREMTNRLLEACPNLEWRLIVSLCRYGGLRCPSEVLLLTWGDILWEKSRIRVRSPKTEHHEGKSERMVPLFPELRAILEDAFEAAPEGAVHLITRTRDSSVNWRTHLVRIIRKAGLVPWPKTIQNLRSSRETELLQAFPLQAVVGWLGNTPAVALGHYLQITEDLYEQATRKPDAKSDVIATRNPTQTASAREGQKETELTEVITDEEVRRILTSAVQSSKCTQVPRVGLEPTTR